MEGQVELHNPSNAHPVAARGGIILLIIIIIIIYVVPFMQKLQLKVLYRRQDKK